MAQQRRARARAAIPHSRLGQDLQPRGSQRRPAGRHHHGHPAGAAGDGVRPARRSAAAGRSVCRHPSADGLRAARDQPDAGGGAGLGGGDHGRASAGRPRTGRGLRRQRAGARVPGRAGPACARCAAAGRAGQLSQSSGAVRVHLRGGDHHYPQPATPAPRPGSARQVGAAGHSRSAAPRDRESEPADSRARCTERGCAAAVRRAARALPGAAGHDAGACRNIRQDSPARGGAGYHTPGGGAWARRRSWGSSGRDPPGRAARFRVPASRGWRP